jgi:protein-tyrosine phosphatase
MIDIHCHILPGLDDGAFSLDDSLLMARLAFENGTRGIICTPHSGPYSVDSLIKTFKLLNRAIKYHNIPVQPFLGQEVYLTENYAKQIRDLENGYPITINKTPYVLVEFVPSAHSRVLRDAVEQLCAGGFKPIIAHPERYGAITEDVSLAERLKTSGALLQINKGSLKGAFGSDALRAASYLLYTRSADFVASDAHSPYERTPKLRDVHAFISERYSIDYADHLTHDNPLKVIANRAIYPYK